MKPVVCILFGGKSSEHEVSCLSAYNILNSIDREKYTVVTVGIKKTGESFLYEGAVSAIKDGGWERNPGLPCVISPNPKHHGLLTETENGSVALVHIDVFFPVLHGKNGEDGTIQGVFQLAQIPYVGNGVVGSSLCMDKILTKKVLEQEQIPVTQGFDLIHRAGERAEEAHETILSSFGYPVVVKPANAGSSVGISLVKNKEELQKALQVAVAEDRRVLIEKMMDVREVECAVLGSHEDAKASCLGEIVKTTEMYDYDTKYIDDTAGFLIPAPLSEETTEKIREIAVRAFYALDCTGLARVDFFVEKTTGAIAINEINTLPGFTDISMYPMLWHKSGVEKTELIDTLISLAMEEHQ